MKISDSEMELMKVIWNSNGEITSSFLTEYFAEIWKPTTVSTFLKRLTQKKFLTMRRDGKTCFYNALISENRYKYERTKEFINEVHGGSVDSLLASLCGGEKSGKTEIKDIRKIFV